MRCLLLPGIDPLLENSAWKQRERFSVQTHAHAPYCPGRWANTVQGAAGKKKLIEKNHWKELR